MGQVWADAIWYLAQPNQTLNLLADPDPYSPLNGGLMLIRPSRSLYHQGIEVCTWAGACKPTGHVRLRDPLGS